MIYIKAILSSVLFLLICSCNDIAKNGDTNERLISVNLEKIIVLPIFRPHDQPFTFMNVFFFLFVFFFSMLF